MITCTPLPVTGALRKNVHSVTIPLAASRLGEARFFAIVVGDSAPRAAPTLRSTASIATVIENIANEHASDNVTHTHEWLTAYVAHLRKELDREHTSGISACVGIAAPSGDRIAVALACSGALGAFVLPRHAIGLQRTVSIAKPQSTTNGLAFPHAAEGTIDAQDTVVIGPAALFEPRYAEQLARAFRERPTPNAPTALQSLQIPDGLPGLVITSTPARGKARSQSSMHEFLATAASTERFLTPSLGPVLRAYGASMRTTVASLARWRRPRSHSAARSRILSFLLEIIRVVLRTIAVGARSAGALLIDGLRLIGIAAARTAYAIRLLYHRCRACEAAYASEARNERSASLTPHASRLTPQPAPTVASGVSRLTSHASRLRSWYRSLPPLSRRLLLCTIVFAALFLISTGALWRRRTTDTEVAMYNATIAKIEELRSIAEARLLFNDRAAARTALAAATEHLATLPRTSHARRERVALIESELNASFDRARMITRVSNPLVVARAGAAIPFPAIGGITLLKHDLVAVAADGRRLARINPRTGAATVRDIQGEHAVSTPFRTIALDERSVLIIDADAHAAIVDTQDGTVQIATIEQPPVSVRDAAVYQQRLYLLHGDGSITRHARTTGGFARGTRWLEPARALASARTMTVTGTITVGAEDGAVATYAAGRRKDMTAFSDIDPPLRTAPHIIASPDGDTIYFGDPDEGRIIAVTAKGLIGQVQSDAFRMLSDLAIDMSGQSLYILRGEEIFVIVPPKAPTP